MAKSFTVLDNSFDRNYFYKAILPGGSLLSGVGFNPIPVSSVQDMVTKLIAEAGDDQIERLIISGHGASAIQAVGCGRGMVFKDNGEKSLKYDLNEEGRHQLLGNADKHLRRLRHKFTRDAVIMLAGCNVGEGAEGIKLLTLISYETDTYVEAGDESQSLMLPGYEGNVIRCYRDTHWVASAKWNWSIQ